jgi:hypothetical protein
VEICEQLGTTFQHVYIKQGPLQYISNNVWQLFIKIKCAPNNCIDIPTLEVNLINVIVWNIYVRFGTNSEKRAASILPNFSYPDKKRSKDLEMALLCVCVRARARARVRVRACVNARVCVRVCVCVCKIRREGHYNTRHTCKICNMMPESGNSAVIEAPRRCLFLGNGSVIYLPLDFCALRLSTKH